LDARRQKKLHRQNHRSPLVTTVAPPAYLAASAQVQIPLKVPPRRISFDRFGRTLAVILGRRGAV
jgi:hypothetical protein